jgi:hypothetical protein
MEKLAGSDPIRHFFSGCLHPLIKVPMSAHDPSDDFSQLPTADGAVNDSSPPTHFTRPPQSPKKQTRIGPNTSASTESSGELYEDTPADPEDLNTTPAPLPEEWQELLESPEIAQTLGTDWEHEASEPEPSLDETSPPPPPQSAPRRTVVGRRSPTSGDISAPQPANLAASGPSLDSHVAGDLTVVPNTQDSATRKQPTAESTNSVDKSDSSPDKHSKIPSPSSPPPTPAAAITKNVQSALGGPFAALWNRWGGMSLILSVSLHALLLIGGATVVFTQISQPQTDFLPGGSSAQTQAAAQSLEHQIQQKKTSWLKKAVPVQKLAVANGMSEIMLPDDIPNLIDLPDSKSLFSDSKLTTAFGGMGGLGPSNGMGSMSGVAFQPFSMFGMQIKAKKLALIMDVSTSMLPHIPRVLDEIDKKSKDSVVVLFFGCGIEPPPPGGIDGDGVYSTSGVEFEKFWRKGGASLAELRRYRINPKEEIMYEDIFRKLSRRPQTFFIHLTGIGYTWQALLSDKVRSADALYWFSDFQDRVDFKQLNIVRENLQQRKQRLYLHAYFRGGSYDLIKTQLVEKTDGDVFLEE